MTTKTIPRLCFWFICTYGTECHQRSVNKAIMFSQNLLLFHYKRLGNYIISRCWWNHDDAIKKTHFTPPVANPVYKTWDSVFETCCMPVRTDWLNIKFLLSSHLMLRCGNRHTNQHWDKILETQLLRRVVCRCAQIGHILSLCHQII